MRIETNIFGGNFAVEKIENNVIYGHQELRDTDQWWFYWRFRMVELTEGENYRVEFTNGEVVGYWGPAVKFGNGDWHFIGEDHRVSGSCFTFTVPQGCDKAEFAFCIPYDLENWNAFVKKYEGNPLVETGVLCLSEKGRQVPYMRIGKKGNHGTFMLTARHHACESTGNFLMEGIIDHLLHWDNPLIYPVLQRYEIIVVPFVDLDGVVDGDQGKGRAPHDHNRDYQEGRYATVRKIKELAKRTDDLIAIDCHSPYKWGGMSDVPYCVRPTKKEVALRTAELGRELRLNCMFQKPEDCLIYEQLLDKHIQMDWDGNFVEGGDALRNHPALACDDWMAANGARVCVSFETTYFGRPWNRTSQKTMRNLGGQLALALEHYLMMQED